jgi:hypothetical protein
LSILLPMLARIGWTFLLSVWPTIARLRAVMRFDLLMFSLELALLKGSKRFGVPRKQFIEIVSALEGQTGIPTIAQQAELKRFKIRLCSISSRLRLSPRRGRSTCSTRNA